jgi:hypothetical protein
MADVARDITRADFGKFWETYFPTGHAITREALQSAKQALLDAGVPLRTVLYYFIELGSRVSDKDLRMVEEIQYVMQS